MPALRACVCATARCPPASLSTLPSLMSPRYVPVGENACTYQHGNQSQGSHVMFAAPLVGCKSDDTANVSEDSCARAPDGPASTSQHAASAPRGRCTWAGHHGAGVVECTSRTESPLRCCLMVRASPGDAAAQQAGRQRGSRRTRERQAHDEVQQRNIGPAAAAAAERFYATRVSAPMA